MLQTNTAVKFAWLTKELYALDTKQFLLQRWKLIPCPRGIHGPTVYVMHGQKGNM